MSKYFNRGQIQEQTEQENKLLQRQHKLGFGYTENGATSCTLKGQFVKPGAIDHCYRVADTVLHSQGLSQTGTVGMPTVTSPIGANLGAQGVDVREGERFGQYRSNNESTSRFGPTPLGRSETPGSVRDPHPTSTLPPTPTDAPCGLWPTGVQSWVM